MLANERIRIAYCIDSFQIGGTELNAVRTAESLDSARVELRIFHLQADGPLRQRYENLKVPMQRIAIRNLYSPATARQALRAARAMNSWRADVLHAHDIYTNLFFVPAGRLFGHASTIASRRWWKKTARGGLPTLNRWAYRFAHRVLANTESVGRMLIEDEGVPVRKVVEIPNFLQTDAFVIAPAEEVARQRRAWGVPEGAFVVGMVARLAAVKNHAMLMRALAQTAEAVFLVIVGDGPERKALLQQVQDLGLQRRVVFLGERQDGAAQHRYFDVSVLTSMSEGFPNSVIEAMAAARPAVATAVGGVPDVIEHGSSGLLVPSDDAPALARAIMDLQRDAALASRLGRAGQALVRRRYHRDVVIEKLQDLYETLAAPGTMAHARAVAKDGP